MTIEKIETDWRATLAPGDIVNFLYPSTEDDAAIEKHRPCLILEIDPDRGDAVVVYGTAARSRANIGQELRINRPEDLEAASLRQTHPVRRHPACPCAAVERTLRCVPGRPGADRALAAIAPREAGPGARSGPRPAKGCPIPVSPRPGPSGRAVDDASLTHRKGLRMTSTTFANEMTALADEFAPPLARLFDPMMPTPEKWARQLESWFALCRTAPEQAFTEDLLSEVVETLISLMHARMTFSLCSIPRYSEHPKVMVTGDLGGAVLADVARGRILRLALRRDPDMACRLARRALRRIEEQRSAIALMIGKAI